MEVVRRHSDVIALRIDLVVSILESVGLRQTRSGGCSCRRGRLHIDSWIRGGRGQDGGGSIPEEHRSRDARGGWKRCALRRRSKIEGRTL